MHFFYTTPHFLYFRLYLLLTMARAKRTSKGDRPGFARAISLFMVPTQILARHTRTFEHGGPREASPPTHPPPEALPADCHLRAIGQHSPSFNQQHYPTRKHATKRNAKSKWYVMFRDETMSTPDPTTSTSMGGLVAESITRITL